MKKSITFILVLALFSCSTNVDNVSITQIESNYPIIIGLGSSQNSDSIRYIGFPLMFSISKNSSGRARLFMCDYHYNKKYTIRGGWGSDVDLLISEDDSLVHPMRENGLIEISKEEQKFVPYIYYMNLTKEAQRLIYEQIKSIHIEANKDTIHWKSIQELKQISPQFIEKFLKDDSISFSIDLYDPYKKWKWNKAYINLPIKVK